MEQWDILHVLRLKGCAAECATKIHQLAPGEIAFFHSNFSLRSQQGQNEWLLEYLNSNCSRHTADPKFTYIVCGRAVCRTVWLAVLGVSQARFYRMRALYLEGKVTIEHASTKKMSLKSNEAVAWMKNYFDRLVNIVYNNIISRLIALWLRHRSSGVFEYHYCANSFVCTARHYTCLARRNQ